MQRLTSKEAFQIIERQTSGVKKIIQIVANYRLSADTNRKRIEESDTAEEILKIINDYMLLHIPGQTLPDFLLVEFTKYNQNNIPILYYTKETQK